MKQANPWDVIVAVPCGEDSLCGTIFLALKQIVSTEGISKTYNNNNFFLFYRSLYTLVQS